MGAILYAFGILLTLVGLLAVLGSQINLLCIIYKQSENHREGIGRTLLHLVLPILIIPYVWNNWKNTRIVVLVYALGIVFMLLGALSVGIAWDL